MHTFNRAISLATPTGRREMKGNLAVNAQRHIQPQILKVPENTPRSKKTATQKESASILADVTERSSNELLAHQQSENGYQTDSIYQVV